MAKNIFFCKHVQLVHHNLLKCKQDFAYFVLLYIFEKYVFVFSINRESVNRATREGKATHTDLFFVLQKSNAFNCIIIKQTAPFFVFRLTMRLSDIVHG